MEEKAYLHEGPLDGQQRAVPADVDGEAPALATFEYESRGTRQDVEYVRSHRRGDGGWHYDYIGQPGDRH